MGSDVCVSVVIEIREINGIGVGDSKRERGRDGERDRGRTEKERWVRSGKILRVEYVF